MMVMIWRSCCGLLKALKKKFFMFFFEKFNRVYMSVIVYVINIPNGSCFAWLKNNRYIIKI